jgi:TRAP-type C4-dicarboxylate transport system substrate-binding protein
LVGRNILEETIVEIRNRRRQFFRIAGMGGVILMLSAIKPLRRLAFADKRTYRGISFLPPGYRAIRFGILGFIDQLRKNSSEVLKIDFFDSASLMKADEQLSALRDGSIQFMFHGSTYITEEFPILGIVELPGLSDHLYEHGERLAIESPLWKLINNELARDNLFMLSTGSGIMEPEYIWSGKTRIAGLADLQGKRCRVMSRGASELLKNLGATVVRIPSAETYLALQRGSVDCVVASVNTIVARNLHESLRLCLKLPVTAVTVAVFFLKDAWEKMPAKEKAAFWEAGRWYDENQARTGYKQLTQDEDWPVVKKAGIEIVQPTAAEREIFIEKARMAWGAWERQVGEEVGRRAIDLALGRL